MKSIGGGKGGSKPYRFLLDTRNRGLNQCPVSFITELSNHFLDTFLPERYMEKVSTGSLFGPDHHLWPIEYYDAAMTISNALMDHETESMKVNT